MRPNLNLINLWTDASHQYHESLAGSPAEEYLHARGLVQGADVFRLGYVATPAAGHDERFKGMLAIPYLRPAGVVAFKFRRLSDGDPKYLIPTGQRHYLFNTQAVLDAVDRVMIVEGELDAIAATITGIPAVAVAGVNAWKPHFSRCFDGINKVIICTDNDAKEDGSNPGQDLAKKLVEVLPNAIRVSLPSGHDVNSTVQYYGATKLLDIVNAV